MLMTQHSICDIGDKIHILKWNHALISRQCAPNQGPLKQNNLPKSSDFCLLPSVFEFQFQFQLLGFTSVHGHERIKM